MGGKPKFGYADTLNLDTANFNGGSLRITDLIKSTTSSSSAIHRFVDAAFASVQIVDDRDTFLNSGATASLMGAALTITTPRHAVCIELVRWIEPFPIILNDILASCSLLAMRSAASTRNQVDAPKRQSFWLVLLANAVHFLQLD